jgi:excinuclease ABC subunit C
MEGVFYNSTRVSEGRPSNEGDLVTRISTPELDTRLRSVPTGPGVYLYRDSGGQVIYVGKAKSLRTRVRSYFRQSGALDTRKDRMVGQVADIEVIVTDTEGEALALENNLIKQNKPRYNVLLRDDKTYPYIKVTLDEPWPRAYITRRVRKDGALYFGPYFPAGLARKTLRFIERRFQVRNCNIRIDGKRGRPCLEYDIHRCLGPCVEGLTSREAYADAVQDVRLFLEGRSRDLIAGLERKMETASAREQFEAAAHLRDAIRTVREIGVRQKMASASSADVDIFGYHHEESQIAVSVFHMRGGRVVNRKELFWEDQERFDPAEFFGSLLKQYYLDAPFIPLEIHVPVVFEDLTLLASELALRKGRKVAIRSPRRGGRRELMKLVERNAQLIFEQRFKSIATSPARIAREVGEVLDLEKAPERIEAFDISNLHGSDIVASMVVWRPGGMRKSEYRRFVVRSVEGQPDDFRSMREVVGRRYRRLLEEKTPMPDLILIDGGLGQLHAAEAALDALDLVDQPLASIAKREEIIYLAGREDEPILLDRRSSVLRLIQEIRDESHRFAVAFHRKRRSASRHRSELTEIPGIGPRTARKLLGTLGSMRAVKEASDEALLSVVNRPQLARIRGYFRGGGTGDEEKG